MKKRNLIYFFAEMACAIGELACLITAVALEEFPMALLALVCCGVCVFFTCRAYTGDAKPIAISDDDYIVATSLWNTPIRERHPRHTAGMIIISVLLLANVNFGITDFLPDFIAYILLCKAFSYAADRAPYFAEAKTGFKRLAWITLMKLPAIVIATAARMGNAAGYDWNAVMSLTFAVLELIFTIPVVTNLFAGLFRLGERGGALALINPKRRVSPDTIRLLTYALVIVKCVFSVIPDFFRLTKMSEDGIHLVYATKGYPISIVITQLIGIPLGIFWVVSVIKYVNSVKKEGQFFASLDVLGNEGSVLRVEKRRFVAGLRSAMTALCVASFFSLELRLDDVDGINVIPHFIYGVALLLAARRLLAFTPGMRRRSIIVCGAIYTAAAIAVMIIETRFLYYYGYDELTKSDTAAALYLAVELLSLVELASVTLLLIYIARAIKRFIYFHTAIYPTSERYSATDRDYHRSLMRRNYFVTSLGILAAFLRCLGVFSRSSVQSVVVQTPNVPTLSFLPSMPWITLVIAVGSLSLIGFSMYFFSTMKEEINMKYHDESF